MKISLLVAILAAVSTTAYFTGRLYLLMAEQKAQMVAVEQQARDFVTDRGQALPPLVWQSPGFYGRGK